MDVEHVTDLASRLLNLLFAEVIPAPPLDVLDHISAWVFGVQIERLLAQGQQSRLVSCGPFEQPCGDRIGVELADLGFVTQAAPRDCSGPPARGPLWRLCISAAAAVRDFLARGSDSVG